MEELMKLNAALEKKYSKKNKYVKELIVLVT
jgi:hypothetical protein